MGISINPKRDDFYRQKSPMENPPNKGGEAVFAAGDNSDCEKNRFDLLVNKDSLNAFNVYVPAG